MKIKKEYIFNAKYWQGFGEQLGSSYAAGENINGTDSIESNKAVSCKVKHCNKYDPRSTLLGIYPGGWSHAPSQILLLMYVHYRINECINIITLKERKQTQTSTLHCYCIYVKFLQRQNYSHWKLIYECQGAEVEKKYIVKGPWELCVRIEIFYTRL